MGQLLEQYPVPITEDRQDYFPGYYYLNSMLQQISRKQDFGRVMKDRDDLFDVDEMKNLVPV